MFRQRLPKIRFNEVHDVNRVKKFVQKFLEKDPQAGQLLNPSNIAIFAEGVRPKQGLSIDPDVTGFTYNNLQEYFSIKLYFDLLSLNPITSDELERFIDYLGKETDEMIIGIGDISEKYGLSFEGDFQFFHEIKKIISFEDQKELIFLWLSDFIWSTEFRIMAWLYQVNFRKPYILPERRPGA